MQIRPVQIDDVAGVQELIGAVYGEYDCVLDAENEDVHLLDPGAYFRERGGEFWVVEADGRVVATVAALVHADSAELKSLYVAPPLRRQGWGRRLVELVERFTRTQGRSRVVLWSDTRFLDAHRLYIRLGYSQLGAVRELNDSNHSVEYAFEKTLI